MNKQYKNCCKPESAPKVDTTEGNRKSSRKWNLRLTYLEYLKKRYAREFLKSTEVHRLTDEVEKVIEMPSKDSSSELKEIVIPKVEFEGTTKIREDQENEEVNDFVWFEDSSKMESFKENSLLGKLRKNILRKPQVDTAKLQREDEDYLTDDLEIIDPEEEHEWQMDDKFKDGLINFASGSLAGIAQIYVSQPLDTVKVKQQTFPKLYRNMFKCLLHTYREDGIIRGLYAGTLPALIASIAENSVLFTAYGACQRVVAFIMQVDKVSELSVLGNACAGFFAAFFSTLIICPTELVKCKLQAVREMKPYLAEYSTATPISSFNLTRNIFVNEGIPGFYRGLCPTFAREMPGIFFFFGGYEATREFFTQPDQTKDDIGPLKTMCAGAVGGIVLSTTTFPADVIKSRVQINNLNSGMLKVGSDILRKEGISALYNGLLATLLKTMPATASLFLVYEYSKKIFSDKLL